MTLLKTIAYVIDPQQSEKCKMLVICIKESFKESIYYKLQEASTSWNRTLLFKLAENKDHLVLEALIKEEIRFLKKSGKSFQDDKHIFHEFHIEYSKTPSLLKLFAGTGKLFFNNKQIVIDLFSKVDFYYRLDYEPSDKIRLMGRLKTTKDDFDINECLFLCGGDPHWFIKGMTLKFIATDISWKDLKDIYNTSIVLNAEQKQQFVQRIKENEGPNAPQITGEAKDLLFKKIDPLPVLKLQDRTGAFATLWFDYGTDALIASHSDIHNPPSVDRPPLSRNFEAEKYWENDLLETAFVKKQMGTSRYYCPLDKINKSLSFLLSLGWKIVDYQSNRVISYTNIDVQMQTENSTIIVKGKISYADYEANLENVVGAFNRKEQFIQITSGVIGLLPERGESRSLEILAENGEVVGDGIKIKKNLLGALEQLWETQTNMILDPSLKNLKERLEHFKEIQVTPPDPSFCGHLRPYQQEGVNWLCFLYEFGFQGMLADDMGLGKTVQVLAFLSRLKSHLPILIVVPTSLIFNWKKEIEKFLPHMVPYLHQGSRRAKDSKLLESAPVILTSYALLRLDLDLFKSIPFECLILDEAQAVKNSESQIARAVCLLQAKFRLSITGTPIENHLQELWAHFRFLIPDLFGDEKAFQADVQAAAFDTRYLQKIKRLVRPFILRRKKEDVAKDLPERIDQIVWVEMGESQRRIYDEFLTGFRGNLLKKVEIDGIGKHRMQMFEAILRLRQICCHPRLVTHSEQSHEDPNMTSGKLDVLMQDIETILEEGRKALVYSQFTSMLSLIAKAFQKKGWNYVYLDGATINRESVVSQFQNDAGVPLFLISLKAGGVGLNLTAADSVFLYDPWWNEAVEDQAISRAHRIGRKDNVMAKKYVTIESIEEKMMKLKSMKKTLVQDLFEESGLDTTLSLDDFQFLLS